jgi:glycosyltransferase involved in cell wall biosynthesis
MARNAEVVWPTMRIFADLRSRVATYALLWSLRRGGGAEWLSLTGLLMPKADEKWNLRISRPALDRIIQVSTPEQVRRCLTHIGDCFGYNVWIATIAIEHALSCGDHEFAVRSLQPCLEELFAKGVQPPKRYVTLLADFQISGGRPYNALRTLSKYAPEPRAAAVANDADFLSASALVSSDADWLAHVNSALERHNVRPISLDRAKTGAKFERLLVKSKISNCRDLSAKVTVIVSCFNVEEYLECALCSVFNQTHTNLEVIAVDDKSSDGTWRLLCDLAKWEPRLKLMRNAKNVGTYVSRNRAFRVSTGEFITTQDADDWSHPDRIYDQLALLLSRPDAIASYCSGLRMGRDGRFEVHQRTGDIIRPVCYASLMYRKEAIINLTGYWDCVRVEADAEYMRRVLRLRGPESVLGLQKPLIIQLRRDNSLTAAPGTCNIRRQGSDSLRSAYRAESARFNKRLTASNARYNFEAWRRPFPAPASIVVPEELVSEAASWE